MDIKISEVFDDSEVLTELEKLENKFVDIGAASSSMAAEVNGAMKKVADVSGEASKTLAEAAQDTATQGRAAAAATAQNSGLAKALKDQVSGFKIGSKSIGEWVTQAKGMASSAAQVVRGFLTGTTAAKIFRVAIASTGIGLLITGVVSLISYLGGFSKAIETGKKTIAGFQAGLNAVATKADELGKIFNGLGQILLAPFNAIFKGKNPFTEIKEGFQSITNGAKEFGSEFAKNFDIGFKIEEAKKKLRDFQIENAAIVSARAIQSEKLRALAENENKTIGQKINLERAAGRIEAENAKLSIEAARQNLTTALMEFSITDRGADAKEKLNEATIAYNETVASANLSRIASQQKIIQLQNEEKQKAEDLRKEYEALLKTIKQQTAAFELNAEDDPVRKLIAEWGQAVAEAEEIKQQLFELPVSNEARAAALSEIDQLFTAINADFTERLVELRGEIRAKRLDLENEELKSLVGASQLRKEARAKTAADELKLEADALARVREFTLSARDKELTDLEAHYQTLIADTVLNEEDRAKVETQYAEKRSAIMLKYGRSAEQIAFDIGKKVAKAFGVSLTDAEAQQVIGGLKTAFSAGFEGLEARSEAAIAAIDAQISKLDELIQKQAEVVEKEKAKSEEGKANNLKIEQEYLADLEKRRAAAQTKRLAEERKAANAQLILDGAQQTSGLVTAAINIMAQESKKGLLGVILAIGAIATVFSIVQKARANAAKFSAPPKLRKGMKFTGKSHEDGGEPLVGPSGQLYEAEKDEWLIGREPSREHDEFLGKLNQNRYRGLPLADIAERARHDYGRKPTTGAAQRIDAHRENLRLAQASEAARAIERATQAQTRDVISALNGRPQYAPWKGGFKKFTQKGAVHETKTVLPE